MEAEKKFIGYNAEIKAIDDEKGIFEGYASVFGERDAYGDVVVKGAFEKSLKENGMPVLLLQHLSTQVGGIYLEAEERENGLYVKGQLNLEVQMAREYYALLKQGAIKGLSIGFYTIEDEYDRDESIRYVKRVNLLEVSLVTFPANKLAQVESVKNAPKTEREFERFLREAGYSQTQSKAIVADGFKGYQSKQRDAGVDDGSNDVQRDVVAVKEMLINLTETLKELKQCRTQSKK